MPAFRTFVQRALCVGAAWAYHVEHEAIISEDGEVSVAVSGTFAQAPNATVTASHNTSAPKAPVISDYVAAPPPAEPKPTPKEAGKSSSLTAKKGGPSGKEAPAPAKATEMSGTPSKADAGKPGALKPAQMMKEAERSLERAEHGVEKAKAALTKANEEFKLAQQQEQEAIRHRESSVAALHQAKEKHATDTKINKGDKNAKANVKGDENAIRKAERAYEIAKGKAERAKESVVEKSKAVKLETAAVKEAEGARAKAQQDVKDARAKEHEQEQWQHREAIEAQKMQAKNDKLQQRKQELASEYKHARQERLANKDADPKDIKHMKAHEEVLMQSVHKAAEQAKELHQAMKAHGKAHGS